MYFNILIPILSVFFNIFSQILIRKFLIKKSLLKTIHLSFGCGLTVFIVCEFIAYHNFPVDWLPLFIVNLVIYGCLSFSFFNFINMGETARRIRLLRELYEAAEGLTKEEILKRYNAKGIINVRVNRLLNNGQIVLREGRYYIGNPLMLFISKSIISLKFIVLGKKSGPD